MRHLSNEMSRTMKLFFDLLPVILFVIIYKLYGIYYATAVMMVTYTIQVAGIWLKYRRLETWQLITLVCVLILGSATLLLHNDLFIKWKPTIIYWLFAAVFLSTHFFTSKPLLQKMLEEKIELTSNLWRRLNSSCTIFFVLMGIANLYVAYQFSTNIWVDFKLATIGISFLFFLGLALYMSKQMSVKPEKRD